METATAFTLTKLIEQIGAWPFGLLIVVILIAPWLVLIFISRGQEKRFDVVTQMYKNNVSLVLAYEKLSDNHQDLVIMNTEAISKLTTIIKERVRV